VLDGIVHVKGLPAPTPVEHSATALNGVPLHRRFLWGIRRRCRRASRA
jgi:hypothetical protein